METEKNGLARMTHVSDTALMVAALRALETERAGAIVNDPFAARLAGERGRAIVGALSILEFMLFGVCVRVKSMDEILMQALAEGKIKTVLNLGAGLDTRPWRLDLPPGLRWLDADFPEMLEYKAGKMAGERPRCRFEQVPANLSNPEDRRKLFERAGQDEALMITEGLLMYLPAGTLVALAGEAPRLSGIRHWLFDTSSEQLMRAIRGGAQSEIEHLQPHDHLSGQAVLDAARDAGWAVVRKRTYAESAAMLNPQRITTLREALATRVDLRSQPRDEMSGVYFLGRGTNPFETFPPTV